MNKVKRTNNLSLVTTMVTVGINPIKTEVEERNGKKSVMFVFELSDQFLVAQKRFFDQTMTVEPNTFYLTLKSVKNRIYELLNQRAEP